MTTFSSRVIQFNKELSFSDSLPKGIRIMNPFQENEEVIPVMQSFYNRFYNDSRNRKFIIGINPGRLGAGATGIPFTDTKRLSEFCKIEIESVSTHEPSSVFIYDLIEQYGGTEKFYADFYINSICPLGFVIQNERLNWVNCNYYDYKELYLAVRSFLVESLKAQIKFGIDTDVCFVLGKKNATYVKAINDEEKLFDNIVVLDHPRYIEQYKSKEKDKYITAYLSKLSGLV